MACLKIVSIGMILDREPAVYARKRQGGGKTDQSRCIRRDLRMNRRALVTTNPQSRLWSASQWWRLATAICPAVSPYDADTECGRRFAEFWVGGFLSFIRTFGGYLIRFVRFVCG